jgi:NhaP-type Na+/H+ or K+/H+ antiporter
MFAGFHGRLGEPMESIFLWIALGFVAGYMVRALISQVRRRRFEEDYGFNPRVRLKPRP